MALAELLSSEDVYVSAAAKAILENLSPSQMQDVNSVARMLTIREHYLNGGREEDLDLELLGVPLSQAKKDKKKHEGEDIAAVPVLVESLRSPNASIVARSPLATSSPSANDTIDVTPESSQSADSPQPCHDGRSALTLWGLAHTVSNKEVIREAGALQELSRVLVTFNGNGDLHKQIRENAIGCMWQLSNV